jgi:hypothetical protein
VASNIGRTYTAFLRYWGFKDPREVGELPADVRIYLEEAFLFEMKQMEKKMKEIKGGSYG